MGTGLVAGLCIGEVSPALVHAVATKRACVTVVSRECAQNADRKRRVGGQTRTLAVQGCRGGG
ncbi:translation initiation factor 4A-2 [Mycolicibacterium brisbanense]|uniref:Translation initiation factor 4A-2 n=1 Tax=Mycolicibacterium brisbanense TaxID=146020 RepID=A0A117I680_9MYCO|nr:translation initiation factor 4A-2 [Mycolicibacterium brisbanense]